MLPISKAIEICTVKIIGKIGPFTVRLVDNKLTKAIISLYNKDSIDIVEGDNCYHNPKVVPFDEIWILYYDPNDKDEQRYILLHEYVEATLMRDRHMSYDDAHIQADKIELFNRQKDLLPLIKRIVNASPRKKN